MEDIPEIGDTPQSIWRWFYKRFIDQEQIQMINRYFDNPKLSGKNRIQSDDLLNSSVMINPYLSRPPNLFVFPISQIQDIVTCRKNGKQLQYLVKIAGCSYRSLKWFSENEICSVQNGSVVFELFKRFGVQKGKFFFNPFFLCPDIVLSINSDSQTVLVKWRGLPFYFSTWEPYQEYRALAESYLAAFRIKYDKNDVLNECDFQSLEKEINEVYDICKKYICLRKETAIDFIGGPSSIMRKIVYALLKIFYSVSIPSILIIDKFNRDVIIQEIRDRFPPYFLFIGDNEPESLFIAQICIQTKKFPFSILVIDIDVFSKYLNYFSNIQWLFLITYLIEPSIIPFQTLLKYFIHMRIDISVSLQNQYYHTVRPSIDQGLSENVFVCPLIPIQSLLYKSCLKNMFEKYENGSISNQDINKLISISNHPSLFFDFDLDKLKNQVSMKDYIQVLLSSGKMLFIRFFTAYFLRIQRRLLILSYSKKMIDILASFVRESFGFESIVDNYRKDNFPRIITQLVPTSFDMISVFCPQVVIVYDGSYTLKYPLLGDNSTDCHVIKLISAGTHELFLNSNNLRTSFNDVYEDCLNYFFPPLSEIVNSKYIPGSIDCLMSIFNKIQIPIRPNRDFWVLSPVMIQSINKFREETNEFGKNMVSRKKVRLRKRIKRPHTKLVKLSVSILDEPLLPITCIRKRVSTSKKAIDMSLLNNKDIRSLLKGTLQNESKFNIVKRSYKDTQGNSITEYHRNPDVEDIYQLPPNENQLGSIICKESIIQITNVIERQLSNKIMKDQRTSNCSTSLNTSVTPHNQEDIISQSSSKPSQSVPLYKKFINFPPNDQIHNDDYQFIWRFDDISILSLELTFVCWGRWDCIYQKMKGLFSTYSIKEASYCLLKVLDSCDYLQDFPLLKEAASSFSSQWDIQYSVSVSNMLRNYLSNNQISKERLGKFQQQMVASLAISSALSLPRDIFMVDIFPGNNYQWTHDDDRLVLYVIWIGGFESLGFEKVCKWSGSRVPTFSQILIRYEEITCILVGLYSRIPFNFICANSLSDLSYIFPYIEPSLFIPIETEQLVFNYINNFGKITLSEMNIMSGEKIPNNENIQKYIDIIWKESYNKNFHLVYPLLFHQTRESIKELMKRCQQYTECELCINNETLCFEDQCLLKLFLIYYYGSYKYSFLIESVSNETILSKHTLMIKIRSIILNMNKPISYTRSLSDEFEVPPPTPFVVNFSFVIVHFGEIVEDEGYHSSEYIYPVGYESNIYTRNGNNSMKLLYINQIIRGNTGPLFRIIAMARTPIIFEADSPTTAFRNYLSSQRRNELHIQFLQNRVDGHEIFGLMDPCVHMILQTLGLKKKIPLYHNKMFKSSFLKLKKSIKSIQESKQPKENNTASQEGSMDSLSILRFSFPFIERMKNRDKLPYANHFFSSLKNIVESLDEKWVDDSHLTNNFH